MSSFLFFIQQQFRNTKNNPGKSLLFLISILVGVALSLSIHTINKAILKSFQNDVEALSGKAHLSISGDQTGLPEALLETVENTPGIKSAIPMIESYAYPELKGAGVLTVLGVDLLKESSIRNYKATDQRIIDDPLLFLNQPDSIILTEEYAQKYHLHIDSKFSIYTEKGTKVLTVRGLLKPEGPAKAFGGSVAIMDIDGARVNFGKQNRIDHIDIILNAEPTDSFLEHTKQLLKEKLGTELTIDKPRARSDESEKMTKGFQLLIGFFGHLALIVSFFMIYNTMKISVIERQKETALLRILGASSKTIFTITLLENVWIGLLAGSIGTFISQYMSQFMVNDILTSMTAQFGGLFSAKIEPLKLNDWLLGISLGVSATFLGGFFPALRASRVKPLEAFRQSSENELERSQENDSELSLKSFIFNLFLLISFFWVPLKKELGLNEILKFTNSFDFIFSILAAGVLSPKLFFIVLNFLLKIKSIPTLLRFSMESLQRSAKSTRSYLSSISFSVILILFIHLSSGSFKYTITVWLDTLIKEDVFVAAPGNIQRYLVQPFHKDLMKELEQVEGVAFVSGVRAVTIRVQQTDMVLKSFFPSDPRKNYKQIPLIDHDMKPMSSIKNEFLNINQPSLVISTQLAKSKNLKKGDFFTLHTPLKGDVRFKILGTVTDYANPNGVLYITSDLYIAYWGDEKVSVFTVNAKEGIDPKKVRENIDATFAKKYKCVTYLGKDLLDGGIESIDKSFKFTKVVEWCALLLTFLTLFSTFSISLLLKAREFMLLRAIGMTKLQLSLVNILEALTQGFLGSFIAVSLGTFVSKTLIEVNLDNLLGWSLQFAFDSFVFFRTIIFMTLVSVVAAALPALKLSRLKATSSSL